MILHILKQSKLEFLVLNFVYMKYFYFSLSVDHSLCKYGVSVLNDTGFITLYLHKYSFIMSILTLKVPVHMHRPFLIIIGNTDFFPHCSPITTYSSQCKFDFSFSYMGQYNFFTSFITKQLQDYVYIDIQIQDYIRTLIYLIFHSTSFVDMVCIFIPAAHQYLFSKF